MVKCIDCMKFKKTEVTPANIHTRDFRNYLPLKKKLERLIELGEEARVLVYYCKINGEPFIGLDPIKAAKIEVECADADL